MTPVGFFWSGRFVSADTLIASFGNPQSLNRYSYVYNRPINHTDPTGHKACDEQWGCNGEGRPPSTTPGKGDTGTNTPGGGNTPADQAASADDTDGNDTGDGSPESPNPLSGGYSCPSCHAPGLLPDLKKYSLWYGNLVGGCVKCHAAVARGQTRLDDRAMLAAIRDWDEFTVSMRPLTVPMMVVMGASFGYTVIEALPLATAASVTTAAAAGEQVAEKVVSSPAGQQVIQIIKRSGGNDINGTINTVNNIIGRDFNITISGPFTPEQWKDIIDLLGK